MEVKVKGILDGDFKYYYYYTNTTTTTAAK